MTLQLVDNTWELKLDTSLDASIDQHYMGNFANPYVVVNVISDEANPSWKQAGNIGQAVKFDNDYAYGEVKAITLNTYLLFEFPLLTGNDYDLYYFPFPRLVTAKIKVWEYLGNTVDVGLKQLINGLESASLPNIENKLIDINELIQENKDTATNLLPPGYYY